MRVVSSPRIAKWACAGRPPAPRLTAIAKVGALLIAGAVLSPIRPAVIVGSSMSPTLQPGQVVLCARTSQPASLHRGDVVLAQVDGDVCVKRVFAVGGDHFWKTWGQSRDETSPQLLDVGTPLAPWKERYPGFKFHRVRIPVGMVYLVGDGINSVDSRQYGPVATSSLIGRVVYPRAPRNLEICEPSVWSSLPIRPLDRTRS